MPHYAMWLTRSSQLLVRLLAWDVVHLCPVARRSSQKVCKTSVGGNLSEVAQPDQLADASAALWIQPEDLVRGPVGQWEGLFEGPRGKFVDCAS
jgi:hypothetical protein